MSISGLALIPTKASASTFLYRMSPTGTLTAHLYVPVTSTVAWAHFYVLDRDWAWSSGPTVALQPGSWITLTWDISTAVARPIHRLGVQFGGDAAGSGEATASLDDALYLDAIDWSHPAYSHTLCAGAYLSGTWTARFPDELAWLDGAGGKHAGLINVFVGWTAPFPADVVNAILDHQGTPMITWEPWVNLAQIPAGAYDAYLDPDL